MSHGPGLEARAGLEIRGARLSRHDVPNVCRVNEHNEHVVWPLGLPARQGAAIRAPEQVAAGEEVRRRGGV
jgi:hypothetical protein